MKPIRIFLIRNLITALFMAAYYEQENLRDKNIRDICIIHWEKASDAFDKPEQSLDKVFLEDCRRLAGMISSEIIICPEPNTGYVHMSLSNLKRDRRMKVNYLNVVKKVFSEHSIAFKAIKEIYHGNKTLHQYIKYLSPKVKLIGFEHGIHEVKAYLVKHNFKNRTKNFLKSILGSLFFIFYAYEENDDMVASLFASRIKQVNKKICIKQISHDSIREVARRLTEDDLRNLSFLSNNNRIGIILISNGYEFAKNKEECLKYHKDFAQYFVKQLKNCAPDINTLIFKPRPSDAYFLEVKEDFAHCFKEYNVLFFDEISKSNYTVEFYLDCIHPNAIFADISSGLFYSKELMQEIKTYTFHEYFIAYQKEHFGKVSFDYQWTLQTYFRQYKNIFRDILPIEIKYS